MIRRGGWLQTQKLADAFFSDFRAARICIRMRERSAGNTEINAPALPRGALDESDASRARPA